MRIFSYPPTQLVLLPTQVNPVVPEGNLIWWNFYFIFIFSLAELNWSYINYLNNVMVLPENLEHPKRIWNIKKTFRHCFFQKNHQMFQKWVANISFTWNSSKICIWLWDESYFKASISLNKIIRHSDDYRQQNANTWKQNAPY